MCCGAGKIVDYFIPIDGERRIEDLHLFVLDVEGTERAI